MQLRFDGHIGFAGGLVDEPLETYCPSDLGHVNSAFNVLLAALSRELEEEMNMPQSRYELSHDHYLFTHVDEHNKMFLHFFAMQVS